MKQFKHLFKKEFHSYFIGYFIYFLFFVYIMISLGGAFYVKDILASKDNSLLSLFVLQPYILSILIPAFTMKLWSEEYKQNSSEFLLTLPVNLNKIIAAKVSASFVVCSLLVIGLLPSVFYFSSWLKLDYLNIFCSLIGVELVVMFFCALGMMFSSLSKSFVISYALSIFTFLLLVIVPQTNFIVTYQNFLFAELGFFDLFYFVSFSLLFAYFTKMIVEYRRKAHKINVALAFLLMLTAIVANGLICWAVSVFDYKADFTSKGIYTLDNKSKEIVLKIKKPLEINIYIAEDYLQNDYAIAYYFEQVSRFLRKYKNISKGMVKINTQKVKAFSDEETMLANKGLYIVNNKKGSKNYFGAIINDLDGNEEVITTFIPERRAYLEEDIDRALLKLGMPEIKKKMGVYFDALQNLDDYEGAAFIFENEYNTALLNDTTYQLHNDATAVVLVNPKLISPVFMYAIDQYVINGGNLVIFADHKTENQLDDINGKRILIEKLLNHWGIELNDDMFDEGAVTAEFANSVYPLKIKSACGINITNKKLSVKPLIENNGNIIGAILEGDFESYYDKNPFADTEIGYLMRKFKAKAKTGRVAVICDADILNENNWIEKKSPDRNIFGAIEKAGNGRFIMALTDYMSGNYIYNNLPRYDNLNNVQSIDETIDDEVRQSTAEIYDELSDEVAILTPVVWQFAEYNKENFDAIMNFTDAGRELQNIGKQIEAIEYQRLEDYNKYVNHLLVVNLLVIPFVETILLYLAVVFFARRKNKKIRRLLNEQ